MTTDFYQHSMDVPLRGITIKSLREKRASFTEQLVASYLVMLNLGTDTIKETKQIKYIKICNFVTMTSFAASLMYTILSIVWANPLWFIAVNSLLITSVAVLYLNKIGHVNTSRLLYLLSVNSLLFIIALIVGPHTYAENFLLVAVLIPFLMYDLDHIKMILVGIILPLIYMMSYQFVEPYFAQYHLSIEHQNIMRLVGNPMEIGLAVTALFLYVFYSRQTELELESTNSQMTLHTTELKRSNADLEQFAYVISHDLKTPVRNISCFMRLLSNKHAENLDSEAKEFVEFAVSGAKRMERLIDDVLAYSRIGRNLSTPTPVNVNDVVNTIRYELECKSETSHATINITRELPIVNSVHSSLMYHIFQNLIKNGLKFNKTEHPEINISWNENTDFYTFAVNDNGIGISQKYSGQIFQMFKRLHTENEYDGTGIGLAICKKIVEHYNGHIWYESPGPDKGTTFLFTIRKF